MGIPFRSATPGTLLCLGATVLLAIVSFNTPLIKSQYFLTASYSSGEYDGTINLGTLGYCLTFQGSQTCVGPKVGYEFSESTPRSPPTSASTAETNADPNDLFGVSLFNIPETITHYLTYVLILHIVALAAAGAATIFGLLSHIGSMSVLCFPTFFASLASSVSLLALVFDLVMFYISKARIDNVNGASASIGISVWLVLAAWLLAGFGGCAYGVGKCCIGSRNKRDSGDAQLMNGYYGGNAGNGRSDSMRLQAMRDEQLRKKEQGLPNFQELERTPLTTTRDDEDKYLYEEQAPAALRRDGSVLQGVGMGYGRRTPGAPNPGLGYGNGAGAPYDPNGYYQDPAVRRQPSTASGMNAGVAGYGAGGAGVDWPGQYGQNQNQNQRYAEGDNSYYDQPHGGYNDPYAPPLPQGAHEYAQRTQAYGAGGSGYPPQGAAAVGGMSMPTANPAPARGLSRHSGDGYGAGNAGYDPYGRAESHDSHYPGPEVRQASEDPYGGYDAGLGAIGMAATQGSPSPDGRSSYGHAQGQGQGQGQGYSDRDHTSHTFGYGDAHLGPLGETQGQGQGYAASQLHVPQPQHLVGANQAQLLASPTSAVSDNYQAQRGQIVGNYGQTHGQDYGYDGRGHDEDDDDEQEVNRPPSYGAVAGQGYQPPPEKSRYRS